jgi:hypothetical protein
MKYKYSPIYKYAFILLAIYMFFKHQNIMSSDKLIIHSIIIVAIIIMTDYIIIKNHPSIIDVTNYKIVSDNEEFFDDIALDDDFDEIIDSYDNDI